MGHLAVSRLTVLYDSECALCRRIQGWMQNQPKYVEVAFVAATSAEAYRRYPKLNHAITLDDLTVISERGAVYWGPKAWLMCMWALKQYRPWALRLSAPELLPTTKRVLASISENRYRISKAVGTKV